MITADQLDGLIERLNVLTNNGFGNLKDEIKMLTYLRNYGEESKT